MGIGTILRKIEEALEHSYKPHGYSNKAYDLALLVYCVGGANLLHALNQCMCIPSLCSIHNNISFPHISAGCTTLRGVTLLTDEIALEQATVYFPLSNSVGGLCWKHAHLADPVFNTHGSATQIASKLSLGEVHLAKEMTFVIAHCCGEDETYPLLTVPSCKEEDHADWEKLLEKVIDTWYSNDTHKNIGPLWSFAGHKILMQHQLDESSQLYAILSNLPGINQYTRKHEVTLDFNYKHVFKSKFIFVATISPQ
ncbi:hypothetical protein PAXRUDRAFT_36050 [Paxillus rubicundulus Ve08.2h10]|uniref:Unplaced genomic scaffold scaffold_1079, whole genome shotgun sequence n=1 Tax=Paxillus rubicundulus Ve08.2h10 TaxID=930991 RepID=A0A0D0DHK6_9AGAM|nr:hypothetical protein PAXRUDRAFT_36050 [Paxillus rubicundulus Ve08.2h10]